jgi:hypothetical protein
MLVSRCRLHPPPSDANSTVPALMRRSGETIERSGRLARQWTVANCTSTKTIGVGEWQHRKGSTAAVEHEGPRPTIDFVKTEGLTNLADAVSNYVRSDQGSLFCCGHDTDADERKLLISARRRALFFRLTAANRYAAKVTDQAPMGVSPRFLQSSSIHSCTVSARCAIEYSGHQIDSLQSDERALSWTRGSPRRRFIWCGKTALP